MKWIDNLLRRFHPRDNPPTWAIQVYGESAAGIQVTEEVAARYVTVAACVKVLAETVAGLPLNVYRTRPDGGKEKAKDHPLYYLLHDRPNPWMSSFVLRETVMAHLLLWGNAYLSIARKGSGVKEIWPLHPGLVEVRKNPVDALPDYWYTTKNGTQVLLDRQNLCHIPALGFDGLLGRSPIRMQMECIGTAIAMREYGGRLFANDARPGGYLKHPGKLSADAQKRLIQDWAEKHQGASNAHRLGVLEEGMEFQSTGFPPEESQWLESRKLARSEIASIFRVPLHLIQDLERSTNNNIEHQSLEFVVHSVRPWLVRMEQALNYSLLPAHERQTYFVEFLVDGLLRGDIKSRYDAYSVARQNGWMSANEVRSLENMNPMDDGDIYLLPVNSIPAHLAENFWKSKNAVTNQGGANLANGTTPAGNGDGSPGGGQTDDSGPGDPVQ